MTATAQTKATKSRTTKATVVIEPKPDPTPRSERRYAIQWRKDANSPWRGYGFRSNPDLARATVARRAPLTGREMRAIDTQANDKVLVTAKPKAHAA